MLYDNSSIIYVCERNLNSRRKNARILVPQRKRISESSRPYLITEWDKKKLRPFLPPKWRVYSVCNTTKYSWRTLKVYLWSTQNLMSIYLDPSDGRLKSRRSHSTKDSALNFVQAFKFYLICFPSYWGPWLGTCTSWFPFFRFVPNIQKICRNLYLEISVGILTPQKIFNVVHFLVEPP